jgi:hypothetical protein
MLVEIKFLTVSPALTLAMSGGRGGVQWPFQGNSTGNILLHIQ